jgi:hypothetical protein
MHISYRSSTFFSNKIPLCVNNLLDEHEYDYSNFSKTPNNGSWLIARIRNQYSCRLLQYSVGRIVACLDFLNQEQTSQNHLSNNEAKELHFVFMGDSRIRQQFFNFLRVRINIAIYVQSLPKIFGSLRFPNAKSVSRLIYCVGLWTVTMVPLTPESWA